mgnify:CR=1 FL=1
MIKKIFYFLVIFVFTTVVTKSEIKVYIYTTVNDQIITNFDIEKEMDYLKILNPKLKELNKSKIFKISKDSLINEIIKMNEINKVFDSSQESPFLDEQLKNLYTRLNFKTEQEFKNYLLNSSNYTLEEIKQKLKIELMWNELIYLKYSNQLNIDREKLSNKIDNLTNIRKEYQLSEIVFRKDKNESLETLISKINSSINEIGFNNTANIYSISDSAKLGGKIGWINENNLSEIIFNNLRNVMEGELTKVIQLGNNFLILKVDKIRDKNVPIDKNVELNKMIKFETNKQLNQYSKIFFDKSKINYTINEK